MPEIEITSEQEERLRALQQDIARDVVGKYGHVRPSDAVEYLLDRYEDDEDTDGTSSVADATPATDGSDGAQVVDGDDADGDSDAAAEDGSDGSDPDSGGDDAMLDEMMSLLDTHDDKWGEASGDERYAVELPDDSTERVRTKDDVKALLFKHYR